MNLLRPALVLVLLWAFLQGTVIDQLIIASLPESLTAGADSSRIAGSPSNRAADTANLRAPTDWPV